MPQELLQFPTSYLTVGIYRLGTDGKINRAIVQEFSTIVKRLVILSIVYCCLSYPVTKVWVMYFYLSKRAKAMEEEGVGMGASFFSLANFTTISLVLSQLSSIIEFFLLRKLKKTRAKVYDFTIQSRAKSAEFWIPYVEEWENPPLEKAQRRISKWKWYRTITGPIFRLLILKVMLLPLNFVPFLNTIVGSFLVSLTLSERLLERYFRTKKMSELEQALFMVERENSLRWLGFFAATLERIPILGIIFSFSNRIAFAMFAHDLEKHQHAVKQGLIPKNSDPYRSKTAAIELDLPPDAIGNFPKKKA
ncbi:hypothetical protein PTTG_00544 [Puccinia triticina 1-1 BBBD Race 1]|uniref:Uncharacterized protein n=2 Tax=Puccinia triticina TaxID=208348 RepID=A0A0C4EIH7_PUCT1|nr:uncharacterized protein PtA15_2A468 [Puccinia triticina]OAV99659.1 hypothetical protein PTTG_00544 [Puccinia triticina 1-1 BBBD Race 1]WAQ82153.1 hypothetical protein PtA15_2A468 [Puccinia triticina]WAR53012.1 hypothetical protein PtB15_2B440 [Puccinia triticina]